MKANKITISLFFSILIIIILRLAFLFIPIYSSETTIIVPGVFRQYEFSTNNFSKKEDCLNIGVKYNLLNRQTRFKFISRSLKKQKSIKCIKDGVDYLESEIKKKNVLYDKLLLEATNADIRIDYFISDFTKNKSLDKDKLLLINDYFKKYNRLINKSKFSLPISYEIKTNRIKNYSLFRYLFSGFILIFWTSYFLLNQFKN